MAKKAEPHPTSEKISNFYFAVGYAMTRWQHVEMALTQLFIVLINADGGATSAAFSAVLSFRTKLAMLHAAAYVRLKDTPFAVEWNALHNRLGKKAQKRNDIAHFMMYQRPGNFIVGEPMEAMLKRLEEEIDWYLQPSSFDGAFLQRYPDGAPQLTTNDIMNRARAFTKASNELWDFSKRVGAHLKPPSESPS